MLNGLVRKTGRTAQIYLPQLQDLGKSGEKILRRMLHRLYTQDFEGLRRISRPPGALYLDVGANRGAASLSIWSLDPNARIVAFEPNESVVERFGRAIRKRGGQIRTVALSDESGELTLYIPQYRGVVFDGLASLDEGQASGWLGPRTVFGFDSKHLEVRKATCPVATLDSFGLDPFFIKIDVQGREYEVLAGGLETIARSEPIVFAESDSLDVGRALNLLNPWGYQSYRFDGHNLVPGISSTNVYLVPRSKLSLLPR